MDAPTTERPRRDLVVESAPLAGEGSEAAPDTSANGNYDSRSRLRVVLMAGGIVAVAVGSGYFWFTGGRYATTDDSYIRAAEVVVSSDVSGIVTEVDVKEGREVKAGDVLFRIDPRQYRNALDNAKAALANASLDVDSMKANYKQLLDDIAAQRDVVANDQVTLDRYSTLAKDQLTITKAQLDQARYTLEADKNKLEALKEQAQTVLAKLAGNPDIPTEQHPEYLQAKAEVDEAQRQFDDATVRAPFSGIVTRVDSLQPGLFVVAQTAGLTDQGAVGLVSTDDVWVEAEMKEIDITDVKPGDHVDVTVDAYPGHVWSGSVDTISPAGASDFSILPAQNSSGNWVKVVQRFLVRIRIDRNPGSRVLRSGMSAEVAIDTGHRRTLSDLF